MLGIAESPSTEKCSESKAANHKTVKNKNLIVGHRLPRVSVGYRDTKVKMAHEHDAYEENS